MTNTESSARMLTRTLATLAGAFALVLAAVLGVMSAMVSDARAWLKGRTVTSGRISWRESARKWHPGQRWLWEAGGLGVFDPAINAFSILTALLPSPVVVTN